MLQVKKYTLNLTDLEIKVEEATNAETWGEAANLPLLLATLEVLMVLPPSYDTGGGWPR